MTTCNHRNKSNFNLFYNGKRNLRCPNHNRHSWTTKSRSSLHGNSSFNSRKPPTSGITNLYTNLPLWKCAQVSHLPPSSRRCLALPQIRIMNRALKRRISASGISRFSPSRLEEGVDPMIAPPWRRCNSTTTCLWSKASEVLAWRSLEADPYMSQMSPSQKLDACAARIFATSGCGQGVTLKLSSQMCPVVGARVLSLICVIFVLKEFFSQLFQG